MKSFLLDDLLREMNLLGAPYEAQYSEIMSLCDNGTLRPVLSSPRNGKKPALHTRYVRISRATEENSEDSAVLCAQLENLAPEISRIHYRSHPALFRKEQEAVQLLNAFLLQKKHLLKEAVSCNERSFQIWQDEKFLKNKNGKTVLKHCGIAYETLNVYETAEPFASFSLHRKTPQNVLIIENSDTFYSMRKALLRASALFDKRIETLIYGAGKRIIKSFEDFVRTADPFLLNEGNAFLYWGDLDYEGVLIFEEVMDALPCPVFPFTDAYLAMLDKSRHLNLPHTKEGQRKKISDRFFSFFDRESVIYMEDILRKGLYIPQEILTIHDV